MLYEDEKHHNNFEKDKLKKTYWLQICVPATKLQQFKQLNIHTKSFFM